MDNTILQQVNSYEDACKVLNREPLTLEQFNFLPEADRQAFFSLHKITTVIEVLNEGWQPDWNDYDQMKCYPWFDMETYGDAPAGSGFSFGGYDFDDSYTGVGARLCVETPEKAKFVGKLMLEDYKHWMKK